MKRIIFLVFVTALLIAGCGKTNAGGTVEGGTAAVEQAPAGQGSADGQTAGRNPEAASSSRTDGGAAPAKNTQKTTSVPAGSGTSNAGDLVIKSENQVQAGSKQAMVNQMDRELNNLVDALNKLEDVNESELVIE